MPGVTTKKLAEIALRRQKVAANLLAGMTYREIGDVLGVAIATISADRKAIFKEWQSARLESAEDLVSLECRRLDRALNSIWSKVLNGDLAAVECSRKLSESRRRLLGLDAPEKREHSGPGGGPINVSFEDAIRKVYGDDDSTP